MLLEEAVKPISYVKSRAAEIIERIAKTHQAIVITQNGEAKAVLTDIETYQKQRDAIAMLRLALLRNQSIEKEGGVSHADAKHDLRNYLEQRLEEQ
ncbi:MAG: type II toxin-antitoxin system Phd/YefM family antitoxin [Spirochaetes bacterium]|nr:type II toxin-antitoxin system Phd/YefM family antitoxin [Spirochaetota bacterium]